MAFGTELPEDCERDEFDPRIVYRVVRHYKYKKNKDGALTNEYERDTDGDAVVDWVEKRPIAETLEEARDKRQDYYHPVYGWIREGYKLERDREAASIMHA